jgi:hypothetical protein
MKIPADQEKYLYSWRFVEIAKYVPSLDKVVRQKKNDLPVMIDINDIEKFRSANGNSGLYTSVWNYNLVDIDKAIRLGSLYFDIDSDEFEVALYECIKLYVYLSKHIPKSAIQVYFTGKKGFHIECEAMTLGINPSNNLPNIFRFIATILKEKLSLDSLDFSVYDARRMWRLPGSKHQSTGLYKTLIPENILYGSKDDLIDYCRVEQDNSVPEQAFDAKANEWFREFTYELEIEKERSKDFIGYFNKYGSGAFKELEAKDKVFSKEKLLIGCPAIKALHKEAVEKKWLDHEARLFLCSILTYTDEAIQYLHEILSNCEDYNVEKSNSHVNDWIRRRNLGIGGRPYTCERANAAGVGCGQCSLDKRKKWIKIGNKYVESEEVSLPSPVRFAYSTVNKGGEYV